MDLKKWPKSCYSWELSCGPIIFKMDWNSNNRLSMRSLKTVNIIFFPTLRLPNIRIFVWQYFTSVTSQRLRTTPIKLLLVHNHLPQIITKIIEVNLLSASSDGQNLLNGCIFQFKAKRAQEFSLNCNIFKTLKYFYLLC